MIFMEFLNLLKFHPNPTTGNPYRTPTVSVVTGDKGNPRLAGPVATKGMMARWREQ
jgi:hypothetical protein